MSANLVFVAPRSGGKLWQGGVMSAMEQGKHDVIVLAAEEFQPPRGSGMLDPAADIIYAPNDDAELIPAQIQTATDAAVQVADALERGQVVLVTCFAGRNRSGLISALALHTLMGMSGRHASAFVRQARENALTNPNFSRFLDAIPAGAPRYFLGNR